MKYDKTKLQPGVFRIPFGSPLHKKIIGRFSAFRRMSRDEQRKSRDKAWKEAENTFTAYMPEADVDSARKDNRASGKQDYVTISVPYSYAMLLTSHTYYTSVLLARDPVFQLKGRHGESQNAEIAMESMLDYQFSVGGGSVPLFIWLMDVGKYGHAVVGHYWDREVFTVSKQIERPRTFMGVPIPGTSELALVSEEMVGYEGNRLYNIRPQDFYTDPRVPLIRFQEGEFCIVFDKVGWNKIATKAVDGIYFNVDALVKEGSQTGADFDRGETGNNTELAGDNIDFYPDGEKGTPSSVVLEEFHWNLIPSEVGLGSSNRPEKWVFTIANQRIIVGAQPLGLIHNRYPFDVISCEVEGYNVFNRSMLEILDPLNKTMEWLFNSHFYNVRAALNNIFVFDPSMIHVRDLEEPGPGKHVRLKPAAYGQDVRTLLHQFPVADVTRSNLNDSEVVASLAQRVTGVNDNVMGAVNSGGRKTATEVRSSTTFGVNRLKTNCEWFSAMGFSPLCMKMTMNTQQLYSAERKYRIVGDGGQFAEKYMQITPKDIAGFFDFVPVDGTLPIDRFAQVNTWQMLLSNLAKVPGMMQGYDLPRIFAFVAQLGGLKNLERFRVQVVPDGVMEQQAAAGNVVPMRTNLNEPGQIPGMGATG